MLPVMQTTALEERAPQDLDEYQHPNHPGLSEDPTMTHSPLTEVQTTNLRTLIAIRVGLERDTVDTCRMFALDPNTAERLRSLPLERVWALVHTVGQVSLFVARDDLAALIDAPCTIAGALAAAHSPRPALVPPSR